MISLNCTVKEFAMPIIVLGMNAVWDVIKCITKYNYSNFTLMWSNKQNLSRK